MVTKKFGVDFHSSGGALTLNANEVGPSYSTSYEAPPDSFTHPDGWTITAKVHEDYYEWINDFEATHPTFGRVWGNFESEVHADSEEAFADFYAKHTPSAWDYWDI